MAKVCEQCGEQFEPSKWHPHQRFCTTGCRKRWENTNAYNVDECTCQNCGRTFKPKRKNRNKFCAECKGQAPRKNPLRGIEPVFVSVCPICREHTERIGHYCSDECRKEINRIKERERAAQQYEPTQCKCKECGTVFEPEYGSKRRAYCSEQCAKRAINRNNGNSLNQRARNRLRVYYGAAWRAYYEPINAGVVFKRDGWTCQLCGCKVKRTKEYHPQRATVDHVVPLAAGGPHWYDNVQTACAMCNSLKSDGELVQSAAA